ncbi:MAG: CsbD family protein [Proteobacteria bacterium]|nr:MAG: CsbD family protein [Pseudomonadota bacterium]
MNTEIVQGKWQEIRGSIKANWNKLTDDDLEEIGGRLNELEGRIQNRYGWARQQTRESVSSFLRSVKL